MVDKALFSSATCEWSTPQDLFDRLDKIYHFTLDVCATKENTKCKKFFSKKSDGLSKDWAGNMCWCNPPYGRGITEKWVKKAWDESGNGDTTVVMLLPSRTDTKWFHSYCQKDSIEFIKGRLKFGGSKNPAPFPSMIVVFK